MTTTRKHGCPQARDARRPAFAAALLLLLLLGAPAGPRAADLDGDGLEEIGVFGIELAGEARGPWLQLYEGSGERISSFFLEPALRDVHLMRSDTDADGRDEIVVLAAAPAGQPTLQIRDAAGTVLATLPVAEPHALDLTLLELDFDGIPPLEIGVAYTRDPAAGGFDPFAPPGPGFFQVLRRNAGLPTGLQLVASHELIAAGHVAHAWRVADFDGDGVDEVVAAWSEPPPLAEAGQPARGAAARIVRPLGGIPMAQINAADAGYDGAQWVVGDFVASEPGMELLVGLRRRADAAGVLRVFSESPAAPPGAGLLSSPLVARDAAPPASRDFTWLAIRDARPLPVVGLPPAPITHDALVGYRQADGTWAYRVWETVPSPAVSFESEPVPQAARVGRAAAAAGEEPDGEDPLDAAEETTPPAPLGGGMVLGADATVHRWLTGEFDGDPTNGDGVVVLFTRGDRSIGFQQWSRTGLAPLGTASAFEGSYIDLRGLVIETLPGGREDLMVVARRIGEAPRLSLWNVNAPASRLLDLAVLGADVR